MKQLRGKKPLRDFFKQIERPEMDLVFVLQDVEDPVNVGAAFRIAEACSVEEIVLSGLSPSPPHPAIAGVGRGMHRRVNWNYTKYASDAVEDFNARGYTSCAVEVTPASVPYYDAEYPNKLCLIVGNEYRGVSKRTLAVCEMAIFIPMYGKVSSLNVHVALGITAYHALHNR